MCVCLSLYIYIYRYIVCLYVCMFVCVTGCVYVWIIYVNSINREIETAKFKGSTDFVLTIKVLINVEPI